MLPYLGIFEHHDTNRRRRQNHPLLAPNRDYEKQNLMDVDLGNHQKYTSDSIVMKGGIFAIYDTLIPDQDACTTRPVTWGTSDTSTSRALRERVTHVQWNREVLVVNGCALNTLQGMLGQTF